MCFKRQYYGNLHVGQDVIRCKMKEINGSLKLQQRGEHCSRWFMCSCIIWANLQNVSTTSWMSLKCALSLVIFFSVAMFCLFSVFSNKRLWTRSHYVKATIRLPLPSHRDGYRGTDTFPAQNRECPPCARPAPCTQPFLPCSTSMVSMSQGHWMKKPRSEYAHVCRGPACSHTEAEEHTCLHVDRLTSH